jgi:transcriptional regulator with XRE-family HTH domain
MSQSTITKRIAQEVRRLRADRGWSAQQLADRCALAGMESLSRGTIAKIESGARQSVTADEVGVLARALGVGPADLMSPARETALSSPLSGLMSAEAESLYRRLQKEGGMRVGTAEGRLNVEAAPAAELLESGVAFWSNDDQTEVRVTNLNSALRMLLTYRQRELIEQQGRLNDGWQRLTPLLIDASVRSSGVEEGIRVLDSVEEIVAYATELYATPKRYLRGTETIGLAPGATMARLRTPPKNLVEAGVRYQMLYQSDYLETDAGSRIVAESARFGEEIRFRENVPIKMLHVDDSVALVGIDRNARRALLVRAPAVLVTLAEWFDFVWGEPATLAYRNGSESPLLESIQLEILRLMQVADDNEIASRLKLSLSTVRRHIKEVYSALEVNNRFAAGVASAKRGWT